MEIKTERLVIRPFRLEDKSDTFDIYKDEETNRFLLHDAWNETTVDEGFQERLDNHVLNQEHALNLAVVLDDKVIGDLYVFYTSMKETIEIGYTFAKDYRGYGYATEAIRALMDYLFNNLHIHRIQANLDSRNDCSTALCERLGMRREAHFIQDYWAKGEWTDSYIYAILASEFKN